LKLLRCWLTGVRVGLGHFRSLCWVVVAEMKQRLIYYGAVAVAGNRAGPG